MRKRIRSTWVSRKEIRIYCIDFSGYEHDREGVVREIAAVEELLASQPPNSLLVTVDIHLVDLFPEIIEFFNRRAACEQGPISKMAILGVSGFQRAWLKFRKRVTWPRNAIFLDDYETAKDWLIGARGNFV